MVCVFLRLFKVILFVVVFFLCSNEYGYLNVVVLIKDRAVGSEGVKGEAGFLTGN